MDGGAAAAAVARLALLLTGSKLSFGEAVVDQAHQAGIPRHMQQAPKLQVVMQAAPELQVVMQAAPEL
jgi:hypothetical protein